MMVHTGVQEPMDDNEFSASLKATQETHRNMMILHCRQSWEESGMTISYDPPPTAAAPTTQQGEGLAEQREIPPLGPTTHITYVTSARQLMMDSPQKSKIPVTGKDPVNSEGVRGTDSNPQNDSHKPAQGREKGRAKEMKQHHVANPLEFTEAGFTQGASRGSNKKK